MGSNQETKICQNCQKPFVIEPEDFLFYEKISVPPPTWCPKCRFIRKFVWRNEKNLYRVRDAFAGDELLSIFSPDSGVNVISQKQWWSDAWDPLAFGQDYDFSRPFFVQWQDLMKKVPLPNVINTNTVNSDYSHSLTNSKNCYLTFISDDCENALYSVDLMWAKDCMDCYWFIKGELCYELVDSHDCYMSRFSRLARQCVDSWFLYDCRNCQNCFGCVGLRNKQYHIFNKPYSKEEYKKKLEEFNLGSWKSLDELKRKFVEFSYLFPHYYAAVNKTEQCSGDNITNAKNCFFCFDVMESENCRRLVNADKTKDAHDVFSTLQSELVYDSVSVIGSRNLFSKRVWYTSNSQYSYYCYNSSNLFGCISLRNKQYCILNKQYTKEEYEVLVPKIIEHMNTMPYTDAKGRIYKYGEFFPPELSPFAYNETIAQEYFPLTKEQAHEQGYRWKEPEEKEHTPTISWRDLPDNIKDVSDSILDEAILCAAWDEDAKKAQEHNCTKVFRIIPQELAFYRKMSIPLPRFCPNSRHFHRIQQRNPLRLWHRKCMCQGAQTYAESDTDVSAQTHADDTQNNAEIGLRESASGQRESALPYINTANHFHGSAPCPNEFETSYAPERPEIVYCEACYQNEVI